MGFFDSVIALFVIGLFSHFFYSLKGKKKQNRAWVSYYSVIFVTLILFIDILMYTGAFNSILGARFVDGEDYMWNTLIFNIQVDPALDLDSIAALLFLCYIPVYMYAKQISRALFGRKSYEKGLLWAVAPVKKPQS